MPIGSDHIAFELFVLLNYNARQSFKIAGGFKQGGVNESQVLFENRAGRYFKIDVQELQPSQFKTLSQRNVETD